MCPCVHELCSCVYWSYNHQVFEFLKLRVLGFCVRCWESIMTTDKRKHQICVLVKLPAASLRPWSVARPAVHGSQHRGRMQGTQVSYVTMIQQKMSARDARMHLNTRRNNIRVCVLWLQVRTVQRQEECWRQPMHLCLPPQGRNFVLQPAAALEQS
jgi:hypothetical protein